MDFSSHPIEPLYRKKIRRITPFQVLATSLAQAPSAHVGCAQQFLAESLVGICPCWAFAHSETRTASKVGKTSWRTARPRNPNG